MTKIEIVSGFLGAGKTTLCSLIPRFYDVTEGAIRIDGTDIRDVSLASLRDNIGIVQQDVFLFGGTLRENIMYGKIDATEEEMIEAAKASRVHHFVQTLPGGYDFELNEETSNISQGQKQLITIARAFLQNPKILILDEATSALDNTTEILIQQSLDELCKGRTTIVVAHRLSTVKGADTIAVVSNGQITELGDHESLLARGGLYASLYNRQFKEE